MFNAPVSFKGRIGKAEYSWSLAIAWLLKVLLSIVTANYTTTHEKYMDHGNPDFYYFGLVIILYFLCAQGVKRCQDIGKNGLYFFIPFYFIFLLFAVGNNGPNRYGPEPDEVRKFRANQVKNDKRNNGYDTEAEIKEDDGSPEIT